MSRPRPVRRPVRALLLATLAVASVASAVGTAAPAPAEPGLDAFVSGRVLDRDGEPLAGALVSTLDAFEVPDGGPLEPGRSVRTAADGTFRVPQPEGRYLVLVCQADTRYEGCAESVGGVAHARTYAGPDGVTDSWLLQTRLFPHATGTADLGDVTVEPVGAVAGRLEGVGAQTIELRRLDDSVAFRQRADAEGDYRFGGIVPGRYYVAAGGEGTRPWASPPVTVPADGTAQVDGRLDPGGTIRGRVVDERGPAAPGTEIALLRRGELVAVTGTDERGRFAVPGLPAGSYRVGRTYDADPYLARTVPVSLGGSGSVAVAPLLRLRHGATLQVRFVGHRADGFADELRDGRGRPVATNLADSTTGRAVYTALRPGTYRVVGARGSRYGAATVTVPRRLGRLSAVVRLDRPTLTVAGRTAPRAEVVLTTSLTCPQRGDDVRYGAVDRRARADARGRYVVRGVVPGQYTVTAKRPLAYVPTCREVGVPRSRALDLPIRVGASVTGRLVESVTGRPLITELAYRLAFATVTGNDPAVEQPALARTVRDTGRFRIDGLRDGRATGSLAERTPEGVGDDRYQVVFPYQDGTPYWFEVAPRPLTVPASGVLDLGDVPLVLRGR